MNFQKPLQNMISLFRRRNFYSNIYGSFNKRSQSHTREKSLEDANISNENNNKTLDNNLHVESDLPVPELDFNYLCDPANREEISENIIKRKTHGGDILKLLSLSQNFDSAKQNKNDELCSLLKKQMLDEALKIPNKTNPQIKKLTEPKVIFTQGEKPVFDFTPVDLETLSDKWGLLRIGNVGKISTSRAYYLQGALATLEQALVMYTVDFLTRHGFSLVSVPDLIHPSIIERCGMKTSGERTQVYSLYPNDYGPLCLSGTAEMALAGMFVGNKLSFDSLPNKVMAVSRCYRAEASTGATEHGIYRVNEFSKVEMFALTEGNEKSSEETLEEFVTLQKKLFSTLNLHFQVLSMPCFELGASAYHKIDIEAWMPGRNIYGEISSTSNCTDYQSRRLDIKYMDKIGKECYVHTVNGTACAVPRMLIAILEQNQLKDLSIPVPSVLLPYTYGLKCINEKKAPKMYWKPYMKSPK